AQKMVGRACGVAGIRPGSVEGAFQASNKNIADAVNSVLTDTIADMAQDTSIHDFIKQNAR
ncbi:YajG family lipoprotein, partial [Klebsiella pneumoniae]